MPLYEYECPDDGSVIEMLRSAADADAPVQDPEGRGRRFVRRMSVFAASVGARTASPSPSAGACCPCGNSAGQCGNGTR